MTSFYPSTTLVVVDPSVDSYPSLVNTVNPGTEVIVLDAARDGVEQITEALAKRRGIESLHILSHGEAGLLQLGNAHLSLETIEHYLNQLQSWAGAIVANADILLYGCRVAAEAVGQQFVKQLSHLTGANIAASTNLTGSHSLGGNWKLEFTTGEVKSPLAFAPEAMAAYPHVLMASIFLNDPFDDATVNDPVWREGVDDPTNPAKVNPFLTARPNDLGQEGGGFFGNPSTPNPPFPPLDTDGSGVLRLTNASLNQAGYVLYNRPFPSSAGLRITFDFYMYGGDVGADGISFFLIDATDTNALPATSGAFGGSLGYAQRTSPTVVPGIEKGYIGLGFDAFGNYSNPTEGRNGGIGFTPDSIALRGSQATGYAYLTGTGTLPYSLDVITATPATREAALRRAEILLSQEGFLSVRVDANNDGIFDASDPGEAPATLQNVNIRGVNGIDNGEVPELFTLGFAASTGSAINAHEIGNLLVETLTAPPETFDTVAVVPPGGTVNVTGIDATDPDGTIASFTILTIPPADQGTLFLGDPVTGTAIPVAAGTILTPEQAKNQLFFQATPGFTGGSYTYTATDNLNAVDETPATVSLVLPPVGPNQSPIAGNLNVVIGTLEESTDLPAFPATDPDGVVTTITIQTLPSPEQGQLYLGNPDVRGELIEVGETLTPAEADQIFFRPAPGFTGGSFTYSAMDDKGAESPNAIITLTPAPTPPPPPSPPNQAPTATGNEITVEPGVTAPVPGLSATDPDGTIESFTITAIPPADQGTLLLNGTPVAAGTQLTPAEATQLSFTASPNFSQTSTFSFIAADDLGSTSASAIFTILPGGVLGPSGCRTGVRRKGQNNRRNQLRGTDNRDTLVGANGNDLIKGKDCPDMIDSGSGRDRAFGGNGNDMMRGRQSRDKLAANAGDDVINAGFGDDYANGGPGDDVIYSRRGNDFANGKGGRDRVWGERGNDNIRGGANDDGLEGRQNNDVLRGDNGADVIYGNLGRDRIFGGQKRDEGRGGKGNDVVRGQGAPDVLFGQRNNDLLVGGSQADTLVGGGNSDTVVGGGGNDLLRGGYGPDIYDYNSPNHGLDRILGFQVNKDMLDFKTIFDGANYGRSNELSYIKVVQRGVGALVRIDANGDAAGGFVNLAVLQGVNADQVRAGNYIV